MKHLNLMKNDKKKSFVEVAKIYDKNSMNL
jgi:hypothetical protein